MHDKYPKVSQVTFIGKYKTGGNLVWTLQHFAKKQNRSTFVLWRGFQT